jgi:transposase
VAGLEARPKRTEARVRELAPENAELRRRLGLSPRNSSKPPSSESAFTKPAPRSLRGRSGRAPGGQPGHPGATSSRVLQPDEAVTHEPVVCRGCGAGLADAELAGVEVRQAFDLPPITVQVIEHRLRPQVCR